MTKEIIQKYLDEGEIFAIYCKDENEWNKILNIFMYNFHHIFQSINYVPRFNVIYVYNETKKIKRGSLKVAQENNVKIINLKQEMKLNKEYLLELAEKREKIAIHTETQEQWNEILDVFRNSKFTCTIQNKAFKGYEEKSTISLSHLIMDRISFGNITFHQKEGYKILSYEDCCKKEIKEELKTINVRIGDSEIGKLIISKTALKLLKNGEKIRVF